MYSALELGLPTVDDFFALQNRILDIATQPEAKVKGNDSLLKVHMRGFSPEGALAPDLEDSCDLMLSFTAILRTMGATERLSLICIERFHSDLLEEDTTLERTYRIERQGDEITDVGHARLVLPQLKLLPPAKGVFTANQRDQITGGNRALTKEFGHSLALRSGDCAVLLDWLVAFL